MSGFFIDPRILGNNNKKCLYIPHQKYYYNEEFREGPFTVLKNDYDNKNISCYLRLIDYDNSIAYENIISRHYQKKLLPTNTPQVYRDISHEENTTISSSSTPTNYDTKYLRFFYFYLFISKLKNV